MADNRASKNQRRYMVFRRWLRARYNPRILAETRPIYWRQDLREAFEAGAAYAEAADNRD